ncbi:MAG: permease-like cell division protein FtsX [Gammaproteobacteria bacterium]
MRPQATPRRRKRRGARRQAATPKPPRRKSGFEFRVPGPRGLARWISRHAQTLVGTLGRLTRQPAGTAMTIAVIGIALALPAGLQLLVANFQGLSGQWDDSVELSVYLKPGTTEDRARELRDQVAAMASVSETELVTADQALEEFRESSGLGPTLAVLEDNPLPHLVVLRPAQDHASPGQIDSLAETLRSLPDVDLVQADTEWVRRLYAMLDVARRIVILAAVMLAVGVVVIVGNTIRLDIQNRRDEIEVSKLIGATDGFIRRPFLYLGFWYGLGGGLLALLLVEGGLVMLSEPVARLAGLYGSNFRPEGPGIAGGLALVGAGAALGWLGAWVSATRHMRRIEPGQ